MENRRKQSAHFVLEPSIYYEIQVNLKGLTILRRNAGPEMQRVIEVTVNAVLCARAIHVKKYTFNYHLYVKPKIIELRFLNHDRYRTEAWAYRYMPNSVMLPFNPFFLEG